jgi:hypothetical protein
MERHEADVPRKPNLETWVPRMEVPIDRGLFNLQLAFAREVGRREFLPFVDAVESYAPLIRANGLIRGSAHMSFVEGANEVNLDDRAYEEYLKDARTGPIPYHEGTRFGCCSYDYNRDERAVSMHFMNVEHGTVGPLSLEKLPLRRREMGEVMRDIKRKRSDAKEVRGHSWLYNLEAYRRIFPGSYTENLVPSESPAIWRSMSSWGQFLDSELHLEAEKAELLMERLRKLPANEELSELLKPPLWLPLRAQGPISAFYEEYGISRE